MIFNYTLRRRLCINLKHSLTYLTLCKLSNASFCQELRSYGFQQDVQIFIQVINNNYKYSYFIVYRKFIQNHPIKKKEKYMQLQIHVHANREIRFKIRQKSQIFRYIFKNCLQRNETINDDEQSNNFQLKQKRNFHCLLCHEKIPLFCMIRMASKNTSRWKT